MITVHHWDAAARTCRERSPADLPATLAGLTSDDVWWLDLTNPSAEEEELVFGRVFAVHPLTREDITRPRVTEDQGAHLPKVEEFPDYLFVIVNPLPPGLSEVLASVQRQVHLPTAAMLSRKHRPQLSAVMNQRVLITHHYQSLDCIVSSRSFLERHADAARRGPDFLFHHVLDAMVDEYTPIVEAIASKLDRLEARIFRDPSPSLLARLLRLKRVVIGLRKTLILEREVLAQLIRGDFELVDEREVVYYRNVYDHLVRYTELIDSAREMVSDLMETHLTAVSTRLNQVMKVLTMISTIVLPMTLVAGIYGMNFHHMPELPWVWGYPLALMMMLALGLGSIAFFKWKKWL
jgi:magnesium transporter